MTDLGNQNPPWLREQAARCFRLAERASDDRTRDSLMEYGRELMDRAERMAMATGQGPGTPRPTTEPKPGQHRN